MQKMDSNIRGVSVNGGKWKVQIQLKQKQVYICTIEDKTKAGQIFDIVTI